MNKVLPKNLFWSQPLGIWTIIFPRNKNDTCDCLGESSKAYLTPDCLQLRMKDWRLEVVGMRNGAFACTCVCVCFSYSLIFKANLTARISLFLWENADLYTAWKGMQKPRKEQLPPHLPVPRVACKLFLKSNEWNLVLNWNPVWNPSTHNWYSAILLI